MHAVARRLPVQEIAHRIRPGDARKRLREEELLAIGVVMMMSIWTRGFGGRIRTPVWYALFLVMFTLMIAMRFGY